MGCGSTHGRRRHGSWPPTLPGSTETLDGLTLDRSGGGWRRAARGRGARRSARVGLYGRAEAGARRRRDERRSRQRGRAASRGTLNALGVTLRLWQDPAAPDTERACCSPAAVLAARATCHGLGRPARDARPARGVQAHDRRAVCRRSIAPVDTSNPCMRCNGAFRFDELVAFAKRAERTSSGRGTTRGSSSGMAWAGRRARIPRRTSRTCSRAVDPALLDRVRFRSASRRRARRAPRLPRAGLAVARQARESGGVLPGRRRLPGLSRAPGASRAPRVPIVDKGGPSSGRTTATGSSRPGSDAGSESVPNGRCMRLVRAATNTVTVGAREGLACNDAWKPGTLHFPVASAVVKLRYRSAPVPSAHQTEEGFVFNLTSPRTASLGPARGAVRRRCGGGCGFDRAPCLNRDHEIRGMTMFAIDGRRRPDYALAVLPPERGRRRLHVHPHGRDLRAAVVVREWCRARFLPVVVKAGGTSTG